MKTQTVASVPTTTDAVVLCVDDDNVTLAFTALILKKNGFTVLTADNWRIALDTFREAPIDLVVLDYEMPEMKGHEVAAEIRSLNPKVPILLHSASPDIPEIAKQATDAQIPKGVEPDILIAAISRLIMNSRTNRIHTVLSGPLHL